MRWSDLGGLCHTTYVQRVTSVAVDLSPKYFALKGSQSAYYKPTITWVSYHKPTVTFLHARGMVVVSFLSIAQGRSTNCRSLGDLKGLAPCLLHALWSLGRWTTTMVRAKKTVLRVGCGLSRYSFGVVQQYAVCSLSTSELVGHIFTETCSSQTARLSW